MKVMFDSDIHGYRRNKYYEMDPGESVSEFFNQLMEKVEFGYSVRAKINGMFIDVHRDDTLDSFVGRFVAADKELRRNGEHYNDPTAYEAIKKADADAEHERVRKVIGCLRRVCELSGFTIEDRIVLRDIESGKIWG